LRRLLEARLNKAFHRLENARRLNEFSELEVAGLLQIYEFIFALCWQTLKNKLMFEGDEVNSPRGVINKAFEMGRLTHVVEWLEGSIPSTLSVDNQRLMSEFTKSAVNFDLV
jgi:hypothetical protein